MEGAADQRPGDVEDRDGADVARGEITAVFCSFRPGEPMKSIEIPAAIREKLERGQP